MGAEAVRSGLLSLPVSTGSRALAYAKIGLLLAVQLALFIPYSFERFIARDEGYYALAAKLVSQGKALYSDFFYTQMPLLPYLYGWWMQIFGYDWLSIRILSSIFVAVLGVLIFERLASRGIIAALTGFVLFCTSHFIYAWYLTIQTYASGVCFLFASYLLFERKRYVWCGIFLGLATCTRLYLIALLLPYFLLIFFSSTVDKKTAARNFSIGLFLGLLPASISFLLHPQAFIFNNLGFHLGRSEMSLRQNLWTKWVITKSLFFLKPSDKFVGAEFLLLMLGTLVYLAAQVRKLRPFESVIPIILLLYVVSLLPTPAYIQYFAALIPFMIIASVEGSCAVWGACSGNSRKAVIVLFLSALTAYWIPLKSNLEKYTVSAVGVPGIGISKDPDDWRLSTIRKIGTAIDKNISEQGTVFALWPGYLLNSKASILPGFENHFGWKFAPKFSEEEKQISNISSLEDGVEAVSKAIPDVIVLSDREYRRYFRGAIVSGNYKIAAKIEGISVYSR